jgi:hypothetical protein
VKKTLLLIAVTGAALTLSACDTMVAPRYSISADNNIALKSVGAAAITMADFTGPADFDNLCRTMGPVHVPDGLTHTQYLKKAFEDELKIAGIYADKMPRVTLSGEVTRLEFSSTRAITGGSWTIDLLLRSSNGQTMKASEYYEFDSGFTALTACKQTAEAYAPAVQNLIGKVVRSQEFATLVK